MLKEETTTARINSIEDAPVYAWVILFAVMIASISAPFAQFKVPPVMSVLMEAYHLNLTSAGWLMSIFAVTGLVLAVPAGIILQKYGSKTTGLLAVASLMIGSLLGALAPNITWFFISRLVEGCGMGLISIVAPAIITDWFPPNQRGLPMGIWATWVSVGSLIIYNLAPKLSASGNWQSVWWASALMSFVAFVLFGLLIRTPPNTQTDNAAVNLPQAKKTAGLLRYFLNRDIWLLAVPFACFNIVVIGAISTYYPTFLVKMRDYHLADASFVTSLRMMVVIGAAPLIGWLSDHLASPKQMILLSFIGLGIYMLFPFSSGGWINPFLMALLGIFAATIPTSIFSSAPEAMKDPQAVGIGMAVLMVGQNAGQLIGPVIFSHLVEAQGWVVAGYWMIPVLAIGFVATWFTKVR
jgi:MFS family permease